MVAGVPVNTGCTLRYLGLTLDGRWKFLRHFQQLAPRVDGMAAGLSRLLPNLRGPSATVKRLYTAVVHSMLMYGALVWAEELAKSAQLRRIVHRPREDSRPEWPGRTVQCRSLRLQLWRG